MQRWRLSWTSWLRRRGTWTRLFQNEKLMVEVGDFGQSIVGFRIGYMIPPINTVTL